MEKTSVPLAQLFEPVREDLKRVDEEFVRHVQSQVELIPRIGKYIQSSGGKRIRPAVLLMAARLCGYTGDRAVLYAAVVEFIHTATLVHDDIIDDSDLRRGRLAVHSQWGNDVTVLLGDYLYIKSMAMALTHDELAIIRLLCDVTLRMIEGELYQLTKNGDPDITEEEHFEIIRRKTAYLFGGCAQIGGMLAGIPDDQAEALGEYGFNLGVAFQLVDDVLDLTGQGRVAGQARGQRPARGQDHAAGDCAHEDWATRPGGNWSAPSCGERELPPDRWQAISALLDTYKTIDYAYDRAVGFAQEAKQHLEVFPPSPSATH